MTVKVKKELGQNFLFDDGILSSIADAGNLSADDCVLEIGPGLGTLTSRLCSRAKSVVAVEFDSDLAEQLKENVADLTMELYGSDLSDKLTLHNADFLQFDLESLPANYKVVANIPYNITSKIIEKLWTSKNPPVCAILLVQAEVAERLAALPGKMSVLAIAVNNYAVIEKGLKVPAKMFTPAPKVDSQLVIMTRRPRSLVNSDKFDQFMYVVRAGFAERRKKLRSSLAVGLHTNKIEAERLLKEANIDSNRRAQELSFDDWVRLSKLDQ